MIENASHLSFFIGKDMSYVFTVNEFLSSHTRGNNKDKDRNILTTANNGINKNFKAKEVTMKIDDEELIETEGNEDPFLN